MDGTVRVDKWMWAARLVKTRAIAVDAIKGGRVKINGAPVKPSRDVHRGDRLEFSNGPVRITVVVRGLSDRRGPAAEAQLLYDETAESAAAREEHALQRRAMRESMPRRDDAKGRPTKRDRRKMEEEFGSRGGRRT